MQKNEISKFLGSWQGKQFSEKYSLSTLAIWKVTGEDPNCDLGGHHHTPLIGYFSGTAKQALEFGINSGRWYQWGHGGNIEKITIHMPEGE